MSILRRLSFGEPELSMVRSGEEIWFKGKDVAMARGYKRSRDAVEQHVDSDH